jgi:L-fuculose-phosphate aldolase
MPEPSSFDAVRRRVADASRRITAAGLVIGSGGNVSERVDGRFAITPTGASLESLEPAQVTIVDAAGEVVDGPLAPSSELFLHLGIYERYGAGAVVHTHSPVATALSCVLDELPCVHYQLLLLGGTVRVAPYRTFGTPELAEVTVAALEGRTAALMANHGAIVYAHDLQHAVENALLLEWACSVYWRAAAIGTPRALDSSSQAAVVDAAVSRSYGTTQPADA